MMHLVSCYIITAYSVPNERASQCLMCMVSKHVSGLCLNHTVRKDSRGVLGTSFRFGPTSEILENIQYGGSTVVKTDSQRSRFIAREA